MLSNKRDSSSDRKRCRFPITPSIIKKKIVSTIVNNTSNEEHRNQALKCNMNIKDSQNNSSINYNSEMINFNTLSPVGVIDQKQSAFNQQSLKHFKNNFSWVLKNQLETTPGDIDNPTAPYDTNREDAKEDLNETENFDTIDEEINTAIDLFIGKDSNGDFIIPIKQDKAEDIEPKYDLEYFDSSYSDITEDSLYFFNNKKKDKANAVTNTKTINLIFQDTKISRKTKPVNNKLISNMIKNIDYSDNNQYDSPDSSNTSISNSTYNSYNRKNKISDNKLDNNKTMKTQKTTTTKNTSNINILSTCVTSNKTSKMTSMRTLLQSTAKQPKKQSNKNFNFKLLDKSQNNISSIIKETASPRNLILTLSKTNKKNKTDIFGNAKNIDEDFNYDFYSNSEILNPSLQNKNAYINAESNKLIKLMIKMSNNDTQEMRKYMYRVNKYIFNNNRFDENDANNVNNRKSSNSENNGNLSSNINHRELKSNNNNNNNNNNKVNTILDCLINRTRKDSVDLNYNKNNNKNKNKYNNKDSYNMNEESNIKGFGNNIIPYVNNTINIPKFITTKNNIFINSNNLGLFVEKNTNSNIHHENDQNSYINCFDIAFSDRKSSSIKINSSVPVFKRVNKEINLTELLNTHVISNKMNNKVIIMIGDEMFSLEIQINSSISTFNNFDNKDNTDNTDNLDNKEAIISKETYKTASFKKSTYKSINTNNTAYNDIKKRDTNKNFLIDKYLNMPITNKNSLDEKDSYRDANLSDMDEKKEYCNDHSITSVKHLNSNIENNLIQGDDTPFLKSNFDNFFLINKETENIEKTSSILIVEKIVLNRESSNHILNSNNYAFLKSKLVSNNSYRFDNSKNTSNYRKVSHDSDLLNYANTKHLRKFELVGNKYNDELITNSNARNSMEESDSDEDSFDSKHKYTRNYEHFINDRMMSESFITNNTIITYDLCNNCCNPYSSNLKNKEKFNRVGIDNNQLKNDLTSNNNYSNNIINKSCFCYHKKSTKTLKTNNTMKTLNTLKTINTRKNRSSKYVKNRYVYDSFLNDKITIGEGDSCDIKLKSKTETNDNDSDSQKIKVISLKSKESKECGFDKKPNNKNKLVSLTKRGTQKSQSNSIRKIRCNTNNTLKTENNNIEYIKNIKNYSAKTDKTKKTINHFSYITKTDVNCFIKYNKETRCWYLSVNSNNESSDVWIYLNSLDNTVNNSEKNELFSVVNNNNNNINNNNITSSMYIRENKLEGSNDLVTTQFKVLFVNEVFNFENTELY